MFSEDTFFRQIDFFVILAVLTYWTCAAARTHGPADVLAELDEDVVEIAPVFLRKYFFQRFLAMLWRFGFNPSKTIRHAMAVYIYRQISAFAKAISHNNISCLAADTLERK